MKKILDKEKRDLGIDLPVILESTRLEKHMTTEVRDGKIVLSFNPKRKITEEEVRIVVRHELCHVLDYLEGKMKFKLKIPFGFSWFPPLALEMDWAYKDYIASKRFINLFGVDEFRKYNNIGLEKFLSETAHRLHTASNRNEYFLNIFTLFKEAVKNYMIGDLRESFPKNIWKVTEWLVEDFDYIESLSVEWKEKSDLLNLTVFWMMNVIDLESIFRGNSLQAFSDSCDLKDVIPIINSIAIDYLVNKWMKRLSDLKN